MAIYASIIVIGTSRSPQAKACPYLDLDGELLLHSSCVTYLEVEAVARLFLLVVAMRRVHVAIRMYSSVGLRWSQGGGP